jgi:hypothetical protein
MYKYWNLDCMQKWRYQGVWRGSLWTLNAGDYYQCMKLDISPVFCYQNCDSCNKIQGGKSVDALLTLFFPVSFLHLPTYHYILILKGQLLTWDWRYFTDSINPSAVLLTWHIGYLNYLHVVSCTPVVPKVGGTTPWGAVGLPRWALIGTRGGRERCYYHRGALVDK